MSAFSPDWLALREGADARAWDTVLPAMLLACRRPGRPLRAVDLGSGCGANLRYLAPLLRHKQYWILLDHDAALLDHAPQAMHSWAHTKGHIVTRIADGLCVEAPAFSVTMRWHRVDLATQLDALALDDVDLVTASALIDLVSREWIGALVRRCCDNRCAVLFALSYDGRIAWRPPLAADKEVTVLVNRHQGRDKGFGLAAGPHAAAYMSDCLRKLNFRFSQGRSDWRLAGADKQLQETLARGWAKAALESDPARRSPIEAWLNLRLGHIARQGSALIVGHVDLLGLPPPV